MYSSPEALVIFADIAKVPLSVAQKIPGLVPKSALNPDQIVGIDAIMARGRRDQVHGRAVPKEKIAELVQMPLQPK